jgi:hypothetical protein
MPLRITLVWNDPPASPMASAVLVNNLDLRVADANNEWHMGNEHISYDYKTDKLVTPDDINNSEQVSIASAPPGDYMVQVLGMNIPEGPQSFALIIRGNIEESSSLSIAQQTDLTCPGSCSGHGSCNQETMMCKCSKLWMGADCGYQAHHMSQRSENVMIPAQGHLCFTIYPPSVGNLSVELAWPLSDNLHAVMALDNLPTRASSVLHAAISNASIFWTIPTCTTCRRGSVWIICVHSCSRLSSTVYINISGSFNNISQSGLNLTSPTPNTSSSMPDPGANQPDMIANTSSTTSDMVAAPKGPVKTPFVSIVMRLPLTRREFTEPKQETLRRATAGAAGVHARQVFIVKFLELLNRRMLLSTSIDVDVAITVRDLESAFSVASILTEENVNSELRKVGFPEVDIIQVSTVHPNFSVQSNNTTALSPSSNLQNTTPSSSETERWWLATWFDEIYIIIVVVVFALVGCSSLAFCAIKGKFHTRIGLCVQRRIICQKSLRPFGCEAMCTKSNSGVEHPNRLA